MKFSCSQMKFALALLALVAASSARVEAVTCRDNLNDEVMDFYALLPADEMIAITVRYISEDKQFQDMIKFFKSEEFKNLVQKVEELEETRNLMNYMQKAGIDIYGAVNKLNKALGLPPLTPPKTATFSSFKTGGIRGYLDEIEALIPVDKLKALYEEKLQCKVWGDFIKQLKSPEFQELVNKVYREPVVQHLLKRARELGVDLELVAKILKEMLGITVGKF